MNFYLIKPTAPVVPILISVPHCGVAFPEAIQSQLKPQALSDLDDTDWFVDKLYDFAPAMGITMIVAHYHRWVIDLNRQPDSQALYNDGRVITGLVTLTDFLGNPIYKDQTPDNEEISFRIENYFQPYHQKIGEILTDLQQQFGKVLLYDAHSIRRLVPSIRPEPFPDLILGDNDEQSASPSIIQTALQSLQLADYQVNHNTPFKGGYITRSFGNPAEGIHALQLERAKDLYLDDTQTQYHPPRAEKMRQVLMKMFENLIKALEGNE
ncbi:MAG: N-formylglutamate amidohydrolase [Microscillaceae bacterium]|jgi:N-formylglutamate amidohydrolase|nr:N-formylglutamate amidohydrolase [Microscillaceae bacterium]